MLINLFNTYQKGKCIRRLASCVMQTINAQKYTMVIIAKKTPCGSCTDTHKQIARGYQNIIVSVPKMERE